MNVFTVYLVFIADYYFVIRRERLIQKSIKNSQKSEIFQKDKGLRKILNYAAKKQIKIYIQSLPI